MILKMNRRLPILLSIGISVTIVILFLASRYNPDHTGRYTSNYINVSDLVIDSISSVVRMFAALAISFVVAIIVGIIAARKRLGSKIIIPIIDILQSVPILGFFPAAIAFFITLFNGSPIGIELAAIFLIFTSMVWNMIFAVYESVLSIPVELLETAHAYRASSLLQFRRLFVPASISKLIYNSILSWASGWYFLTAAEIISLGSKTYTLPGLGSFLSTSVSSGEYLQSVVAIVLLVSIIMLTDFFFWRPLESYANRFKYDYSSSSSAVTGGVAHKRNIQQLGLYLRNQALARVFLRSGAFPSIHLLDFLIMHPRPLIHMESNRIVKILIRFVSIIELHILPIVNWLSLVSKKKNLKLIAVLGALVILTIVILIPIVPVISKSFSTLSGMYSMLFNNPHSSKLVSQIPLALLLSYLRLVSAYLITLAWTIPVAIKIANSPHFSRMMPVFQTVAAIPATAFFPFVAALVPLIPGGLAFPSILLILTGMQWYVLFNLIGGVRSISSDIEEVSKAFRVTKTQYIKRVLFPSIYPSLITGSITGWGGGWNSLIVAEYLVFGNKIFFVLGIGSLIDFAAYNLGNTVLLLMLVGLMSTVVVITNRLLWRRLYAKIVKKYSMSG
jgi:NitT/TauT family transport system permease protein